MQGAKEKQQQYDLTDTEETFQWMVDILDATLERVDRAVDEGNNELKQYQKPALCGSQVLFSSWSHTGPPFSTPPTNKFSQRQGG